MFGNSASVFFDLRALVDMHASDYKKEMITILQGTLSMTRHLFTLLAATIALIPAQKSFAQDKWQAHIDLEGKVGNERDLGEADLFLPLWQNNDTLLFGNLRGRIDNNDSQEGNFGIGLRQMQGNGWNLGGYAYFDHRNSPYDNSLNQITLGAEALSLDWDFRANAYIPVGRTSHAEDSAGTADFSGSTITYRGGEERAMGGFDAEIGRRIPLFDADAGQQLRAYIGGYHFSDDKADTIAGPRGRLDLTFDEVPFLWQGARLSVGAEIQHDDPRGTQGFASLRLRIPLQRSKKTGSRPLTRMERRMADPVIRDIDIVSQAGAFGEAEAITTTADGKAITLVSSDTTASPDLANEILTAGNNSIVILNGSFDSVNDRLDVQDGQTIMGTGSLNVQTPSGRTVSIATPGASLSGSGAFPPGFGSPSHIFNMADNSRLIGVNVATSAAGATTAIRINGADNVDIINNTMTVTAAGNTVTGIQVLGNAQNTVIRGNTITSNNDDTFAYGMSAVGSANLIFENNVINVSGATNNYLLLFNSNNTNLSGSGNSGNVSTCNIGGGVNTGSIGFTMATPTCP
ncbi:inverse autotransporter beta domain-containing protein [Sneathiella sp.]|uniref:inverse autotransporter beta domain-containing protein n=1 Tax=Sneathiella sp. TaxID=1964365 RepID=UPI0025FF85C5|nr:inverse autotransporter beta domain-containing protein [Sneathiella sp.]